MNSFQRFQERNKKGMVATQSYNSQFIKNGLQSTLIVGPAGEKMQAAVVNKQEQDYAYIYTDLNNSLACGSTWVVKDLHFIITKEITTIQDVNWRKYHALICNVNINDTDWGYFKGPGKTFIEVKVSNNILESSQRPVLVVREGLLQLKDKIVLKGRPWLVQEYDNITTDGIAYCSLEPSTISKEITTESTYNNMVETRTNKLSKRTNIELTTEDGHFKTNNKVDIIKLTNSKIIFTVPFGIKELIVETKQNGEVVSTVYTLE